MTIRNSTPSTEEVEEPDFFSAPIYEYAGVQSSYATTSTPIPSAPTSTSLVPYNYYNNYSTANTSMEEPFSSATALTTGQSYRRPEQQLITIPSSSVLLDTSPAPITTTTEPNVRPSTRPVQVTPVDQYYPLEASSPAPIIHNNNNNTKYIRQYGLVINRKNAHLPEPVLRFKQARKRRTVVATWTGGAVGLIVAGPIGAAVGAGAAYASAKSVGKTRERRLENRYNNNNVVQVARPVEQVIV